VVTVNLSSTLRRHIPGYEPERGISVECPEGTSVRRLIEGLGIPAGEVKVVMVDGIHRDLGHPLKGHERLALFPAVGGG
jgi:sulfur carrier protein ThiS